MAASLKVMDTTRKALSVQQVAELEDVNEKTIERLCRKGDLPAYRIGRQWRIEPDYRERLKKQAA